MKYFIIPILILGAWVAWLTYPKQTEDLREYYTVTKLCPDGKTVQEEVNGYGNVLTFDCPTPAPKVLPYHDKG